MRRRFMVTLFAVMAVAFTLTLSGTAAGQKFLADDPIREDPDRIDTPAEPSSIELSDLYDRLGHIFHDFGDPELGREALNVNTVDEAPNSAWFTNRHGMEPMSIDALRLGPNRDRGPDEETTWTVTKGKSEGRMPGFQIQDANGQRYLLKADPLGIPELSSAAEVVATKILHAIGYNVPENFIVFYDPDRFRIAPGASVNDEFGDERPLTDWRLKRMLRDVPRGEDGAVRMMASKYISGVPLGPFRYFGTRSDDPNDIIPHEHRRELRGLRLFAAWINHDDARAHNSLDSWVEEDGRHYVRHYLIDFGSTFGAGLTDMSVPNVSGYWLDLEQAKENALGFGIHVPEYRTVEWAHFPEYESVGRWEAEAFDPETWVNDYPNPAFERTTARDAFWAAKILMRFTRRELETIVATGEYGDSRHSRYFLDVLMERQRKCGAYGINGVNPLDGFQILEGSLTFENLSETYGFAARTTRYGVRWFHFDNDDGSTTFIEKRPARGAPLSVLPETSHAGTFLMAQIESHHPDFPHWKTPVRVYVRVTEGSYEIVGVDRQSRSERMTKEETVQ